MKATSQIFLLVLLHFSSAAPLPPPRSCADYLECRSLHDAYAHSPPSTSRPPPPLPPSELTPQPHFPDHQPFPSFNRDSHPVAPPIALTPSNALSAHVPLSSAYLLSLANPSSDALPSKPTPALPSLRKADAIRYWREHSLLNVPQKDQTVDAVAPTAKCAHRLGGQPSTGKFVRDYNDLMVVVIVVLFLLAVLVLELIQKVGDL